MADKTIPQLIEVETIQDNSLAIIDSGTQTFKIRSKNLATELQKKMNKEDWFFDAVYRNGKIEPLDRFGGDLVFIQDDTLGAFGQSDYVFFLGKFSDNLLHLSYFNGDEIIELGFTLSMYLIDHIRISPLGNSFFYYDPNDQKFHFYKRVNGDFEKVDEHNFTGTNTLCYNEEGFIFHSNINSTSQTSFFRKLELKDNGLLLIKEVINTSYDSDYDFSYGSISARGDFVYFLINRPNGGDQDFKIVSFDVNNEVFNTMLLETFGGLGSKTMSEIFENKIYIEVGQSGSSWIKEIILNGLDMTVNRVLDDLGGTVQLIKTRSSKDILKMSSGYSLITSGDELEIVQFAFDSNSFGGLFQISYENNLSLVLPSPNIIGKSPVIKKILDF